jgi:hypothetical protein
MGNKEKAVAWVAEQGWESYCTFIIFDDLVTLFVTS